MFGPRFNTETTTVFNSVLSGSPTANASVVCNVGTTPPSC
jgi:hypothetical protein